MPTPLSDLPGWSDERQPPVPEGRRRLRDLVARLRLVSDRIVTGELDERAVTALAAAADAALATPTEPPGDDELVRPDAHPWLGLANVGAPPMRLRWDGRTLTGAVRCGPGHEGPPGTVHGGVIAGLFDAMVATCGALNGTPITAKLTIDYLAPTPLRAELSMDAVVERQEGRKAFLAAHLHGGEVLCARADALMLPTRTPDAP